MTYLIFSWLVVAQSFAAAPVDRLNKNGVALCESRNSNNDSDCYDPVSYVTENKAVKVGAESAQKFRHKHKEATYVFSTQAHLEAFKQNPDKYLPSYGGWCAYAVAVKKEKVDVDPKSFHVQDGKLLLFYDGFLSDTRKSWLHDKSKDRGVYLKEADANWPATINKEP